MKVLLKIIKWIVVLLVVLTVLVVGGLYGFLKYGLTGAVQQHVLPEVLSQTGLDTELEHVGLDLFNGTFNLQGLRVKNPAGFVEPDFLVVENAEVMVRLKSLLKQDPIEVQRIKLQGAKLHIIRNSEKVINLQQLQTALADTLPAQSAQVDAPPAEEGAVEPLPLPALVLKSLEADVVADYVDHSDHAPVEQGSVSVNIRGHNLATATVKDIPWGEMYLISNISVDGYEFPANFNMKLAPFDQPENLSFDLKGAPFEIDAALVQERINSLGLDSEKVRLEVDVKARDGVFVAPDSVLGTELQGVKLDKSVAGVELAASALRFKVPVSGTVMKPVVDWKDAIQTMVNENQKVLIQEVGSQLLDKAVKPAEKAGIQALGQALGIDFGLTEETESSDTQDEVNPEASAEAQPDQTKEQKVVSGLLRVLEESDKEDGEPEATAIEEVLKIFGN